MSERRITDITTPPSRRAPRKIADALVKTLAASLRVSPKSLRFDKVNRSMLGTHVLYQQERYGLPVSGAWLRIDIAPNGSVYHVLNDLVPDDDIEATEARVSGEEAESSALDDVTGVRTKKVTQRELCHYEADGAPYLCWKVVVRTTKPLGAWKFYISAIDGKIVERHDLARRLVGKGRVFDPNPIATLDDASLRGNSLIAATAYRDVDLPGLDGSGFLDGEFVSTRLTANRVKSATNDFVFTRDQRGFREVMAYFHIDRVRRHLTDLGFKDVMNRAIEVHVDFDKEDVAQYVEQHIELGSGGIACSEDAEIIVHEYGHAIQDDQVPGFGAANETMAMGEGFGDFLAASFFCDRKPLLMQPTFSNWNGAPSSKETPPCMRRLDSKKKYPKDIVNDLYDDSAIWSASLWQLREKLGAPATETLVIAHHHLLSRTATFNDAANALLITDKQLNGGANADVIRRVFEARGILKRARKVAAVKRKKRAGEKR
ncbi:MAG TPA: M36 family metallopeptidase [Thermoanaerobaculia bacterium]|nr:M36 family metallopeptidase [Thermoanaerobaculia bacterium]